MIEQLLIFGICFLLGIVLRLAYKSVTFLEKKTNLLAVTIILDISLCLVAAAAYTAIIFFMCEGQIFVFSISAIILGFGLTALLF